MEYPLRVITMLAAALILAVARDVAGNVTIEKKPPAVEHKTFDPADPPKEMPPLNAGESAVTESRFECKVELNYQEGKHERHDGKCTSSVQVQSVRAVLELRVIIWLPQQAPAKLSAHEEGHRRIAERVYRDAEKAAREVGRQLDGTTVIGTAETCAAAERQATQDAASRFCQAYMDRTAAVVGKVGDRYDELTSHGRKTKPDEDEAIREAFEKEAPSRKEKE